MTLSQSPPISYHLQLEIFTEDHKLFQHFDNENDVICNARVKQLLFRVLFPLVPTITLSRE